VQNTFTLNTISKCFLARIWFNLSLVVRCRLWVFHIL